MEKKILIADDDAAIQGLLKRALGRQNYAIFSAYQGNEVIEMAIREQPQIILLDLNMPGKKGDQILLDLRSHPKTKMIPVIFQTGAGEQRDVIKGLSNGADDYICKPFSMDELVARIESILRRCSINLDANPLTKLPGSSVIESEIRRLIEHDKVFSVLYCDLNEFKAFNDYYGAHRGDKVIQVTADILRDVCGSKGCLVGHIGGDDFVVVCEIGDIETMCETILKKFDSAIPDFYDECDRKAGFIMVSDRRGDRRAFSMVSLAIGVVTNQSRPLKSMMEISAVGAEVKSVAKKCEGSAYFMDRRRDAYLRAQASGIEGAQSVQ